MYYVVDDVAAPVLLQYAVGDAGGRGTPCPWATGLFGRGLGTRLATNAIQGMMFSVVWKAVEERLNARG